MTLAGYTRRMCCRHAEQEPVAIPGWWARRRSVAGISVALICLTMSACTSLYHHPHRNAASDPPAGCKLNAADELRYVETDDEGWFWKPDQAAQLMQSVESSRKAGNTFVVLFAHGWHHSAASNDAGIDQFCALLGFYRRTLEQAVYRESRETLGFPAEFRIIGVYAGWRGKSLPMPINYLTFWARKSAAERIGSGDLGEMLARLDRLYEQHKVDREPTLFGLLTIGHSFGAQVLLQAQRYEFERRLREAGAQVGYPRVGRQPPAGPPSSLVGIGDLSVLVNPAIEAEQWTRIDQMARSINYAPEQAPVVLVATSVADFPLRDGFPFGRRLGRLFAAKPVLKHGQKELERTAIGFHGDQVTHRLCPTKADNADLALPAALSGIDSLDLSAGITLNGVTLTPEFDHPGLPFVVARTAEALIPDHNDIFREPFMGFVIQHAGLVGAKRAVLYASMLAED